MFLYILLIPVNTECNNTSHPVIHPMSLNHYYLSNKQRLKILISACEPKRIIIRVLDNTIRLQPGQREREGLEINNAEIVSKVGEDERERKS